MNRAISLAMVMVFSVVVAASAQAAPKGKVGVHKPVGVTKAPGSGFNFGNVTNPIVNTIPKKGPGPINGAPAFPPRFPVEGGHGPVVLNPPHHGPINGLPVPYKPQPTHCSHHHHCNDWRWYVSMCCGCDYTFYFDNCNYDLCYDMCW